MPSIAMTQPCSFYSTFLPHLILLVSCWSDCESPLASTTKHSTGFGHISPVNDSMSAAAAKCSALIDVICGVSDGSVLGPILFIIYTADLESIVAEYGLSLHQYADDSQIYSTCRSDATSLLATSMSQCVDSISSWMRSDRLQLNADKTEVDVVLVHSQAATTSKLSTLCRWRTCFSLQFRSRPRCLHRQRSRSGHPRLKNCIMLLCCTPPASSLCH